MAKTEIPVGFYIVTTRDNLPNPITKGTIHFLRDEGAILMNDGAGLIEYSNMSDINNKINLINNNIESINNNLVDQVEILATLNSIDDTKALAASQGKILNEKIKILETKIPFLPEKDEIPIVYDGLNHQSKKEALSANMGYELNRRITEIDNQLPNKINTTSIYDDLNSLSSTMVLSAKQGKILADRINTKLDITQYNEILSRINEVENKIPIIDVKTHDVINNLMSDSVSDGLSAYQGKLLKEMVDSKVNKSDQIQLSNNLETNSPLMALTASMGVRLKKEIDELDIRETATPEDMINGNSNKVVPALTWLSWLDMDYQYTEINDYGNPTNILYKDGTLIKIYYKEDGTNIDYYILYNKDIGTYKTTYQYNSVNFFVGKSTVLYE